MPNQIDPMAYDRLVMKLAVKYGADKRLVRDSEQYADGWLGLLRACQQWDPAKSANFMTYAYISVQRAIIAKFSRDQLRKRRGWAPYATSWSQDPNRPTERIEDYKTDQDDELPSDIDETKEQVEYLIDHLDRPQRRMVRKHYFQGKSHYRIGLEERGDWSAGRVKYHIRQAMKRMREVA